MIDPVLVTKTALINAASIASLLLTTAAMITDKPQPKSAAASAAAWVEWEAWAEWEVWVEWAEWGGMGGMGMDMM